MRCAEQFPNLFKREGQYSMLKQASLHNQDKYKKTWKLAGQNNILN